MPSPFPGMNPYLEQESVWHDFHERFLPLAAELLGTQVLPRYIVKIDENMYVHELDSERRHPIGRADLWVAPLAHEPKSNGVTQLLEAPCEVESPEVDIEGLSFLEIRDRESRQLITVIELLSPSNKYSGPDRERYLAKVRRLLRSQVHFVEIDLLRGGPRMPWIGLPECDYYVVVSRAEKRPKAGMWPVRLRDPLPVIPIPLQQGDPHARLDLQEIVNRVYDAAGYRFYIYADEPNPRLSPSDAEWAKPLLRQP